jgi:hypothetical protein
LHRSPDPKRGLRHILCDTITAASSRAHVNPQRFLDAPHTHTHWHHSIMRLRAWGKMIAGRGEPGINLPGSAKEFLWAVFGGHGKMA